MSDYKFKNRFYISRAIEPAISQLAQFAVELDEYKKNSTKTLLELQEKFYEYMGLSITLVDTIFNNISSQFNVNTYDVFINFQDKFMLAASKIDALVVLGNKYPEAAIGNAALQIRGMKKELEQAGESIELALNGRELQKTAYRNK